MQKYFLHWFLNNLFKTQRIEQWEISNTDKFRILSLNKLKYQTKTKYIPVDRLTVERKRYENRKDMEYEYYSLILFKYGSSQLEKEHKKVVDFVKNRISENSVIKINVLPSFPLIQGGAV